MPRLLSMCALTLLDMQPPETVRIAAEAGYDALGLRMLPASDSEERRPMIGKTSMVADTKAAFDDTGIEFWDAELVRLTPDLVVSELTPFLETAAWLGARHILVTSADADTQRMADKLSELTELARPFGLTPQLEFIPWTPLTTLEDALDVLRQTTNTESGLIVDPYHLDRSGGTVADLSTVPIDCLQYAQICDAPAEHPATIEAMILEGRTARLPPGEGSLPLAAMLDALPDGLPLGVEVPFANSATAPPLARARRALMATRQLLDAREEV